MIELEITHAVPMMQC